MWSVMLKPQPAEWYAPPLTPLRIARPGPCVPGEAGFTIDIGMSVSPLSVDRLGIFAHKITGFEVACRFKPLDQTEANYLLLADLNGAAVKPGQAFGVGSYDLTISGTGVSCVIPAVGPGEAGLAFGNAVAQPGEITFHSTQEFAVGVPSALITWTIS